MSENADSLPQPTRGVLALAGEAMAFAFGFLIRRPAAVLHRVVLPSLLGGVILYFLLWAYCAQLIAYIDHPSDGLAGRVMGIAAAGVLIMLLLHAVVVSRLGALVLGREGAESAFLSIGATAWRIYVANLRLVLAFSIIGVATALLIGFLRRIGVPPVVPLALKMACWLLLLWLVARCWFFLAPVSLEARGESVLATSWRRSEGLVPAILLVLLAIVGFSFFLLAGSESLLRLVGIFSPMPQKLTLLAAIGLYERNLIPFVSLVSAVYLCGAGLMTAVRVRMYGAVTVFPPA